MKHTFTLLCALLGSTAWGQETMRIVGYLPDYRAATFNAEAAKPLTHLFVFSAEPTADGALDLARLKNTPWDKLQAHRKQHGTRLVLCVGGWERSTHFPTVVADAQKRAAFVKAAVVVCTTQSLDGLDLDWEHPKNAAEQQGYAKLLQDLQAAFAPKKLTLSVTMAAWQQLPKEAFAAVDTVNLMAYDHDGEHSTYENTARDVKKMLDAGVPAAKLVLGVPFYGRHVTKRDTVLTYAEIVAKHKPAADVDNLDGLYFNGPKTMQRKVALARERQLAGVMIWEIGQDAPGDAALLKVIHSAVQPK